MITLAIETAIREGSISLIKDNREIDFWVGNNKVSKAEDILEQISLILNRNHIKKINLIAVSDGPGSATGIRIGLATSLGLAKSFGCKIIRVSIFEALIYQIVTAEPTILAISIGGRQVTWIKIEGRLLNKNPRKSEVKIGNLTAFLEYLDNQHSSKIIFQSDLKEIVLKSGNSLKSNSLEIMQNNLAFDIGLKAIENCIQ